MAPVGPETESLGNQSGESKVCLDGCVPITGASGLLSSSKVSTVDDPGRGAGVGVVAPSMRRFEAGAVERGESSPYGLSFAITSTGMTMWSPTCSGRSIV